MSKQINILFIFLFGVVFSLFSQENEAISNSKSFIVKVRVVDKEYNNTIKDAEVKVNGFGTSFADFNGIYKVKANINDELIVSHPDFETVRYTIKSDEDVKILVEGFPQKRKSKYVSKSRVVNQTHLLDSADFYKKKDIDKSLSFITKALKNNNAKDKNATAYKILGDVYSYWKQYDLAIENYTISLGLNDKVDTRLQLAKNKFLFKKYKDSEQNYKTLLNSKLTSYQVIVVNEGLGDVYLAQQKFAQAKTHYQTALNVAKKNLVTPKITDLNSKLAEVSANLGNTIEAETLFKNSLDLASKENKKRSLKEQERVADYYNKSSRYDDEIKLRQQTLEEAEQIESLELEAPVAINKDSINTQKINYKIGNAYLLKEEYPAAISYFKKSKSEAKKEGDFEVEKDATRRISEAFATVGNDAEALKNYKEYVKLVDEDYVRKQQEIQQTKRFSKKISDNQNRISSLEKDKELNKSKISLAYKDQQLTQESNKRQQYIIYSLIAGFLLMSLLAYFMFRTTKQQKLANNLLALKSMRSQMNPHFIFNALNSVNSFIAVNDERNANRYLSEFSVLMRSVLENSDEDFIPFTKEIELLELYVKLEHNRFKDKFDYQINVDKNIDLDQFSIPPMLLQPYIENAIWHGLRYRKEKGNLSISIAQKDAETLQISIEDNGIGRKQSQALKTKNQLKQKSKGMSTIKNRIAILNDMYKERISVTIADVSKDGSGTKVDVFLKK
ncbi:MULTISPECIES: tetratricopeptide repeat-containing sensor histidine kinase [Tenacibaculum]|uniref:tetratricopeptide repeat-containing sensor histidine kinase n=1 Tax=Tenacibaculum TaxID=104267 RepID=UPI001F0A6898|nr:MULTISPECIES: histidine kinase [Tenacibaculum]MCH3880749.1 histidine kinase [Tenacibaculum aquimarinum]MDO6599652.1 histidine kinase [Tenacibaculum sp. 1_MG-2023]